VEGVGRAYGTFGELLQGVLPEPGGDFLVTLPIARWACAEFRLAPGSADVRVVPEHKDKARRLARLVLERAGAPNGGVLTLRGGLPEGKGLASSSADLVATARAVGEALGVPVPARVLEDLLRRVEATDGVLYPGNVVFDHRRVRLLRRLGSLPTMTIVGIDEGGVVDTMAFNRIAKPFSAADRREYARLLDRLAAAVPAGDLAEAGRVATRSAQLNQVLNPRRTLDQALAICRDVYGLGVVAAHSGTMLGILLNPRAPGHRARVAETVRACAALEAPVSVYRSLSFTSAGCCGSRRTGSPGRTGA